MTGRKHALEPDLKSRLQVDPAERPLWELLGLAALKPSGEHYFHLQLEQEVPSGSPLLDMGEWELPAQLRLCSQNKRLFCVVAVSCRSQG